MLKSGKTNIFGSMMNLPLFSLKQECYVKNKVMWELLDGQ